MPYLNIDTKKGIVAMGVKPYQVEAPAEEGSCKLEVWANKIDPVEENRTEYKDVLLYRMEPGDMELVEPGHAVYSGHVAHAAEAPPYANVFNDSMTFDPGTLEAFRVWNAKPNVTIVKDGEVIARNVQSYDSRPLHRPIVQAGIGIGAVIVTGLIGRWLDWW